MIFFTYLLLGFIIAVSGSIVPSFLNLTVVKFSLRSGRKSAYYLIVGFATVLFFQANIGAYLSSILMKNSEYIILIQNVGTVILFLLSINFFRLYFSSGNKLKKSEIDKSKAYIYGVGMSLLNAFAIPFYFTSISLLIGLGYFEYTYRHSLYFSIGSTLGSFSLYAVYASVSSRIEYKLTFIATKMDFILGCLTGVVGIGNLVYLIYLK